jgi:hypothetical protein
MEILVVMPNRISIGTTPWADHIRLRGNGLSLGKHSAFTPQLERESSMTTKTTSRVIIGLGLATKIKSQFLS